MVPQSWCAADYRLSRGAVAACHVAGGREHFPADQAALQPCAQIGASDFRLSEEKSSLKEIDALSLAMNQMSQQLAIMTRRKNPSSKMLLHD
jgi:hypothetical protein